MMHLRLIPVLLGVAISLLCSFASSQSVYPRDGNEILAMRIHNKYVQSRVLLAQLETARDKTKGFINEVAPASTMVGTAIDPDDTNRLNVLNGLIAAEIDRLHKLEAVWESNRSTPGGSAATFAGRYGPLASSFEKSSANPSYGKIEYAIRTFPFATPGSRDPSGPAQTEGATTKPASSSFSGTWAGSYSNSRNEPGNSVTTLVETGGKVQGTDDGLTILDGKRAGNTMSWRLESGGGFSNGGTTWYMTVQILDNGNTLVERYTARDHRKDKNDGGSYSGMATLHRK
jgi:hypothetical protein